MPSLPSDRKNTNVSIVLRHDADADPLPSKLERVCKSCLVPSLPSSKKDINVMMVYLMRWTPSKLERVCKSCLVPSLPSSKKDINVMMVYLMRWTRISCPASWKEFAKAA